jgi:ABC-2 type transport system ATP-binding protein
MTHPVLNVNALSVRRGDLLVLSDLSFEVREGEVFGLLGPNGSGKSTTFSVLAGLLAMNGGELLWRGQRIEEGDKRALREVGFVGQNPSLDPNLTARENLNLTASLYRVPRGEREERVAQLLQLADLSDRADEQVSTFSGGMKRRLDIARALTHNPKVLILDEPTTGLDEGAFQHTWRHLLSLRDERGLTIIMSTHRPEEAAKCDRIAFIDKGQVVACDTPEALQRLASQDTLTVHCDAPSEAGAKVSEALELEVSVTEQGFTLKSDHGHILIPRVVEALPPKSVHAIQLTRPHLGDVFLHLTGASLAEETQR